MARGAAGHNHHMVEAYKEMDEVLRMLGLKFNIFVSISSPRLGVLTLIFLYLITFAKLKLKTISKNSKTN